MIIAIGDPTKAWQFAECGKVAPIGAAVFVPRLRQLFLPEKAVVPPPSGEPVALAGWCLAR